MFGNFWLDDYLKKHPEAGDPRMTPEQPFGTPSSNWPWSDPSQPQDQEQDPYAPADDEDIPSAEEEAPDYQRALREHQQQQNVPPSRDYSAPDLRGMPPTPPRDYSAPPGFQGMPPSAPMPMQPMTPEQWKNGSSDPLRNAPFYTDRNGRQIPLPPPPPDRKGSPWSNREQISSLAPGLIDPSTLRGSGGGQGLLGGTGGDTLGTGYQLDEKSPLSMLNPRSIIPGSSQIAERTLVDKPNSIMPDLGLKPRDASLLGSGGDETLGGSQGGLPADDGSNPSFFSSLFGGTNRNKMGIGLSNIGAMLMASAGGDTAKGAEALQQGGALWAKERETASEEDYRKKALQMRQQELNKEDITPEEKHLNALGLHRGDPGFNEGMERLIYKDSDNATTTEKEFQRAQNDPAFMKYLIERDRRQQPNTYFGEGGKYGKPDVGSSYVYEQPIDPTTGKPDPTAEPTLKMETITTQDGQKVQRPMTVPTEGSPRDLAGKANEGMKQTLGNMVKDYRALDEAGGITNITKTPYKNFVTRLGTTELGQEAGQAFGTKTQAIRARINLQMPDLINQIRTANQMGAKSMDSNTELNFYMKMATDPKVDIHTNYAALDILARKRGYNTLLEDNGVPQSDIDIIRNRGASLQKQAPAPGFEMPSKWLDVDKGNTEEVWKSLTPRAQQAWIDKYYPD